MSPRQLLLDCCRAALDAVDARRSVRESLLAKPLRGDWHLVAVGKAAAAMAFGAVEALGTRLRGGCIVVPEDHVPAGFQPAAHGLQVSYGAHPVPDERSLAAGDALVQHVASLPTDARLLGLVSGGASALVEYLRPGVTLADLVDLNRRALAADVPIEELNALRREMSRIKGGGLAAMVRPRRLLVLAISDVPRDDPRVIGSGLLHGAPTRIVASLRTAMQAAADSARSRGHAVVISRRRLAGAAAEQGRRVVSRLARVAPGTLLVSGGETTVVLPEAPGRGGRNQHLALAAAIEIDRRHLGDAQVLALGTDGVDGASEDAGALVDGGTCLRGRDDGLDPHVSLAAADSGSFLAATGDLLHTGPTLTNVGDLVLALRGRH